MRGMQVTSQLLLTADHSRVAQGRPHLRSPGDATWLLVTSGKVLILHGPPRPNLYNASPIPHHLAPVHLPNGNFCFSAR